MNELIHWFPVDGGPMSKKNAFSKISGFVCTGPLMLSLGNFAHTGPFHTGGGLSVFKICQN